jgi:hypothetical protein
VPCSLVLKISYALLAWNYLPFKKGLVCVDGTAEMIKQRRSREKRDTCLRNHLCFLKYLNKDCRLKLYLKITQKKEHRIWRLYNPNWHLIVIGGSIHLATNLLFHKVRPCLDPLSFYKIWFLAIAYKNWFLKKTGWGCLETSLLKL